MDDGDEYVKRKRKRNYKKENVKLCDNCDEDVENKDELIREAKIRKLQELKKKEEFHRKLNNQDFILLKCKTKYINKEFQDDNEGMDYIDDLVKSFNGIGGGSNIKYVFGFGLNGSTKHFDELYTISYCLIPKNKKDELIIKFSERVYYEEDDVYKIEEIKSSPFKSIMYDHISKNKLNKLERDKYKLYIDNHILKEKLKEGEYEYLIKDIWYNQDEDDYSFVGYFNDP